MRRTLALLLVLTPIIATVTACGGQPDAEAPAAEVVSHDPATMPDDDAHSGIESMAQHDMGLNTEITLSKEIRDAWTGVVIRVSESADSEVSPVTYRLKVGASTPLGDTGLTATALDFVPDFLMDGSGITSRSTEPNNPAVRIRIVEDGKPEYVGWLFANMPTVHPFPHETYAVVLVEGIPAP